MRKTTLVSIMKPGSHRPFEPAPSIFRWWFSIMRRGGQTEGDFGLDPLSLYLTFAGTSARLGIHAFNCRRDLSQSQVVERGRCDSTSRLRTIRNKTSWSG